MLLVNFKCQPIVRGSQVMLVVLEEKLKAPITCSSLICKFSDQIQNCPILINKVKKTGHSDFSNGQNFQPRYKRNDWSKFLEKQKQNIPTKWDKSCCMMGHNQQNSFPDFFKVWIPFSLLCHYFVKYFTASMFYK